MSNFNENQGEKTPVNQMNQEVQEKTNPIEQEESNPINTLVSQIDKLIQSNNKIIELNDNLSKDKSEFMVEMKDFLSSENNKFRYNVNDNIEKLTNFMFQIKNETKEELSKMSDKQANITSEFAGNIHKLSNVKLDINEKDKEYISNIDAHYLKVKGLFFYNIWLVLILFGAIALSAYFANNYYEKSVLTREEVRQEILTEFKQKGQTIVDEKEYQALVNETRIIKSYIEKYKDFSKSYLSYREGVISANKNKSFLSDIE